MTRPSDRTPWFDRARAAGIHAALSALLALCAAGLVFVVWYPYPYRELSGGRELFSLVVSVDVILGPLLTLVVFNRSKPSRSLRRDIAVIVLMQLAGLGYGIRTVALARPVHLVWEIDRMRVVHAVDVPSELLGKAPPGLKSLPLTGPTTVAIRPFHDANENMEMTLAALGGAHLGARPDMWQPYTDATARIRSSARPVDNLKRKFPQSAAGIDEALNREGLVAAQALWLPLVGRKEFWTVFLKRDSLQPVAYLPLDPN